MNWINILHLYQPPTQSKETLDLVTRESYRKIIELLDKYDRLKLTINISGSLLELLLKYGHEEIIAGFKKHAERGAIEFLGSAMYHPILPLLEAKEIKRQIELQIAISKKCFGGAYSPRGFYLPEMAYSRAAAEVIASAGFEWLILDEIHTEENIDLETHYSVKGLPLGVLFRNSKISKTFPPEYLVREIQNIKERYVITCHDGELYGHWHKEDHGYYEKAFTHPDIQMLCVSQYLAGLLKNEEIALRDASWESAPDELEQNIPHGLWNDPRNDIHQRLESLKRAVLVIVEGHQDDPGYEKARHHADRGVASCAWWWASERKLGPFSPLTWNPTEIEKGAKELYMAVKSLSSLNVKDIADIETRFNTLKKHIWEKHKKDYDPDFQ